MRYVIQTAEDVLPRFLWFHPRLRLMLICWLQNKIQKQLRCEFIETDAKLIFGKTVIACSV